MACLAQTNTGDLDLSSGNLVVVTDVATETATKLNSLFGLWKGEWFQDLSVGVPYLLDVLVKAPVLPAIDATFQDILFFAPGVQSLVSKSISFDSAARALAAVYKVKLTTGQILSGGPGAAFVISSS